MSRFTVVHYKIILCTFVVLTLLYFFLLSLRVQTQNRVSQADASLAQSDTCGILGLGSISSPTGYSFTFSCTQNNLQQYEGDARFSFFQLTPSYASLPYVKTPNSAIKDLPGLTWSMQLNRPSQLYLFFRRIPGVTPIAPSWAANYSRITPDGYSDLTKFMLRKSNENGLIGLYDIWKSNSANISGQINFGAASDTVQSRPAYSMYIVGIRPSSNATATASPNVTNSPSPTPNPSLSGGASLVTSGVIYTTDSSANSSRSRNTSIKVPENVINTSQGWIATRIRMGFPSTTTLAPDPNIFDMSESDAQSHFIYYDIATDTFHFERTHGGTVNSAKQIFAAGDFKTLIVTWSTTQIKISVDGSPFVSIANNHVTGPAPFMIGHSPIQGVGRQPNSDYYWVAAGTGLLTDENAQIIHSFGNTDHPRADFPGTPTFMWDALSDRYNNR